MATEGNKLRVKKAQLWGQTVLDSNPATSWAVSNLKSVSSPGKSGQ